MPGEMTSSWAMLMALGAFHGINPGMGWLFAVALGMQERRRGAVLRALVPLGAGHALAVAGAVAAALAIGAVIPIGWLRWPLACVLVSLGAQWLGGLSCSKGPRASNPMPPSASRPPHRASVSIRASGR